MIFPLLVSLVTADPAPAVTTAEFVYESAPFPSCHASTLAETPSGLVAAWFGGTREKAADVCIYSSRKSDGKWSAPAKVADGVTDGKPLPCWNPVLFKPKDGPLLLFYKVGPSPDRWWGMLVTSADDAKTWSEPRRLPDGTLGPIKNKPVQLPDGTLLCPSSTEDKGWRVHLERTADLGKTWASTGPLATEGTVGAIQPSVLFHPEGRLQILCRTKQLRIAESWSEDGGKTWTPLKLTELPNPNSGIDAVTLRDGRHLLVYNPTGLGRTPLAVALSRDGKTWNKVLTLETEPGEYSYPAVIQGGDGTVHVSYTWKRQRVKHVAIDPAKLER
jgi:predicted neuraminidase